MRRERACGITSSTSRDMLSEAMTGGGRGVSMTEKEAKRANWAGRGGRGSGEASSSCRRRLAIASSQRASRSFWKGEAGSKPLQDLEEGDLRALSPRRSAAPMVRDREYLVTGAGISSLDRSSSLNETKCEVMGFGSREGFVWEIFRG